LKKDAGGFDLPIALGLLLNMNTISMLSGGEKPDHTIVAYQSQRFSIGGRRQPI
jgi:hypothetical protein